MIEIVTVNTVIPNFEIVDQAHRIIEIKLYGPANSGNASNRRPAVFVNFDGTRDVYLVTSRRGGRWIIPKGNPISGLAPHEVASKEALEEAGLVGKAGRRCIGTFEFSRRRGGYEQVYSVDVYPLHVERRLRTWMEKEQRSVLRCDVKSALSLVAARGLASLINRYLIKSKTPA